MGFFIAAPCPAMFQSQSRRALFGMTKLRCVDGDTLAEKQLNLSQKPGLSVSQNSAAASPRLLVADQHSTELLVML